ncbi:hypothetical protein [Amycolatopsis sp. CA-230715]|uniref:hypothetical protein n=1 Tax=Amycolatopsis sp. CA-230715 TaxID=2745196 RepID=UPI001C32585C|nr:hypothetical protein [Amycolatopsis sp. CA-230715]QWF80644.1 hypothetical protein HUW46_04067 [Amycolatopsis sp. CA-230715]
MSLRSALPVRVFAVAAGAAAIMLTSGAAAGAGAGADEPPKGLVHANADNACRLNVRTGAEVTSATLTTLTCDNYTTCAHADPKVPCGPFVVGGKYSCVGPKGVQLTDNRWAEVLYRAPQRAYVAIACGAVRV